MPLPQRSSFSQELLPLLGFVLEGAVAPQGQGRTPLGHSSDTECHWLVSLLSAQTHGQPPGGQHTAASSESLLWLWGSGKAVLPARLLGPG